MRKSRLLLLFPIVLACGGWGSVLPLGIEWIGQDARIGCEQSEWGPDEEACRAEIMRTICGPKARIVDVSTTSRPPLRDEWYETYVRNQRVYKWTFFVENCRPV